MNKNKEWILNHLNNGDNLYTHEMYTSFLNQTESRCSYKSYQRQVQKVKKEMGIVTPITTSKNMDVRNVEEEFESQKTSENEDGSVNYESTGFRITNIEEFLDFLHFDKENWIIKEQQATKWEVGIRVGDHVKVEPLFRIYFKAIPKVLSSPTIELPQPVTFSLSFPKSLERKKDESTPIKNALILGDAQMAYRKDEQIGKLLPIHERRTMDIAIQIAKDLQPEKIVILGDMFDLGEWSPKFTPNIDILKSLTPLIKEFGWYIGRLKSVSPYSTFHFIEGNHEKRIASAMKQIPFIGSIKVDGEIEGLDLISIPNIFGFSSLGIDWIGDYPKGQLILNQNTVAEHGDVASKRPGDTAAKMLENRFESVIFGHVHRIESATRTVYTLEGPRDIYAQTFGCMCSLDGSVPSNGGNNNWQNGFGILTYDSWYSTPTVVRVFDDMDTQFSYWNGKRYESNGYEYVKELVEATNWTSFDLLEG